MFVMSRHPDSFAVSFQEQHALAPWRKNGKPSSVNSSIACDFHIDGDLLQRSLQLACANHAAFSTRFSMDAEGTFRRRFITEERAFQYIETDIGESLDDPLVDANIAEFFKTSFGFEDPQWLRVLLNRTHDGSSLLVFRAPHLIHDAASVRIFLSEVWRHYEALARGEVSTSAPARFTLQDYAGSQQQWAASGRFDPQLKGLMEHTRRGLENLSQQIQARQAPASRPATFCLTTLPDALQVQLTGLAGKSGVSLNLVLLAGAVVFLSRISRQRAFCFRMPFSGRIAGGTDKIVGFLSNDLPVFVSIDATESFSRLVRRIQQESMAVMRYGEVPWHQLATRLQADWPPAVFDDYLINVIPAVEHFGADPALRARSFPLPVIGKTSSLLKILMYVRDRNTSITLIAGEDEKKHVEEVLLPECVRVLTHVSADPEAALQSLLDGASLLHSPP